MSIVVLDDDDAKQPVESAVASKLVALSCLPVVVIADLHKFTRKAPQCAATRINLSNEIRRSQEHWQLHCYQIASQ